MRLTAAIAGIEAEDRGDRAGSPAEAGADVSQKVLEPSGRVSVRKEELRIAVCSGFSASSEDMRQIGGEIGIARCPVQNVRSRLAEVKDRLCAHRLSPPRLRSSRAVSARVASNRSTSAPGEGIH